MLIQDCFTFDPPFENDIGIHHQIYVSFKVMSDDYGLQVFMHNKDQMYVPKIDKIFGSEFLALQVDSARMKSLELGSAYDITTVHKISKTHWKAIDTPHKRCSYENKEANTTQCISQFFENKIGCSMGLSKSNSQFKRYQF